MKLGQNQWIRPKEIAWLLSTHSSFSRMRRPSSSSWKSLMKRPMLYFLTACCFNASRPSCWARSWSSGNVARSEISSPQYRKCTIAVTTSREKSARTRLAYNLTSLQKQTMTMLKNRWASNAGWLIGGDDSPGWSCDCHDCSGEAASWRLLAGVGEEQG